MKQYGKHQARMGRPPLPAGKARTERIIFRVEPSLRSRIVAAAKKAGKSPTAWIRDILINLLGGD